MGSFFRDGHLWREGWQKSMPLFCLLEGGINRRAKTLTPTLSQSEREARNALQNMLLSCTQIPDPCRDGKGEKTFEAGNGVLSRLGR